MTVGGVGGLIKSGWIAKPEFETQRQRPEESPAQLKALADTTRELLKLVSGEVADLRRLQPPVADQEAIETMLGTVEGSVPLGEEFADAIEAGDGAEIEAATARIEKNSIKGQGLARGHGLKVCGSGE